MGHKRFCAVAIFLCIFISITAKVCTSELVKLNGVPLKRDTSISTFREPASSKTGVIMYHKPGQPPGSCPLNHLHFHGLAWKAATPEELGQPLVLLFDHDRQHPIDKVWVAKLATRFYRKKGNQMVFNDRDLAFQTYKKDMIFNAARGHTLLYQTADVLWLQIHLAYHGLSQPSSEWSKINKACASVGYEQVDMWHVPEKEGHGDAEVPDTHAAPEEAESDAESSSSDEGEDDKMEDGDADVSDREESGEGRSSGASGSNEAAGGNQRMEQQRAREEALNELGDEFDPEWEFEEDYEEVKNMMRESEEAEEADRKGEILCAAYERLVYLKGVRDARDGFKQRMDSLGGMISWMACQSLNKHDVLRFAIMFEARKPFTYVHPETNKETSVDPRHCVRIVVADFKPDNEAIPDLFRWGQPFIKAPCNRPALDREVEEWRRLVKEHCMDNVLPVPEQIAFVGNSKHQRGNSLLCVYGSAQEASLAIGQKVEMGEEGTLMRWHGVVNRRAKQKMAGGVSMPRLPTMQEASTSAKALTEHTLGHPIHHLVQPYYACEEPGQRVLSERSIRLKKVPANVTPSEIVDWFVQGCGVRPTAVFKDSAAKNRGGDGQTVAMVAEFLSGGNCHEQEAAMEKAMSLNNSSAYTFRGERVILQRIKKAAPGERIVFRFSDRL